MMSAVPRHSPSRAISKQKLRIKQLDLAQQNKHKSINQLPHETEAAHQKDETKLKNYLEDENSLDL